MSAYDQAVINATATLKRVTSELTVPSNGGLMAVDKNNPNNVVLFNAAGIGVSDDGGATFKNSITGEGVVAETIIGDHIIGVNLSSIDETGYFHVNGSSAEFFDTTSGRRVEISPSGLYGYNANNSVRFQADSTLVTSAALGTSNYNVYLAVESGKEVRVVDVNDVPSDGEIGSYTYRNLRARGVFTNFIEANSGIASPHVYGRPRSGGEFRITGANTTDVYYPLRAGYIFGASFVTTSTSAWVGTDSALHVVNKGYASGGSGDPIYRDIFANDVWARAFITRTENAYIGTDNELRVVNKGLGDIYRAVKALNYLLPSGEPAMLNTFSLLSVPPKENEATDLVKDIELVRHTSGKDPAYKVAGNQSISSVDGSAMDIEKAIGLLIKSTQELIEKVGA